MPDIWEGKFTRAVSRNSPFLQHYSKISPSQLLCQCNGVDLLTAWIYSKGQMRLCSQWDSDVGKLAGTIGDPNHAPTKGQLKFPSRVAH